jgi:hypothetical protein
LKNKKIEHLGMKHNEESEDNEIDRRQTFALMKFQTFRSKWQLLLDLDRYQNHNAGIEHSFAIHQRDPGPLKVDIISMLHKDSYQHQNHVQGKDQNDIDLQRDLRRLLSDNIEHCFGADLMNAKT